MSTQEHPVVRDGCVSSLDVAVYEVPTDGPEADGTLAWDATTVVVVRVGAEGVTGTGWTYGARAAGTLVEDVLRGIVVGSSALDVPGTNEAMVRACRNLGRQGVAGDAISAVDIALWDLKARLLDVPLAGLFGRCRDEVPAYGSGGFTTYDDEATTRQLERFVGEWGTRSVKLKIGESWGANEPRDLARCALARGVVGDGVALMVDANGAYTATQAVRVGRRLHDGQGIVWFEEPVSSDDLVGLRHVRANLGAVDVAAGEYLTEEYTAARMLRAEAVDVLQIDVTRCGGYTTWLRIAGAARAASVPVSGHCAPSLHAHVAVAVPNAMHVEYFHDHWRCDHALFDGALTPRDGVLVPVPNVAGHGMVVRPEAATYRVR